MKILCNYKLLGLFFAIGAVIIGIGSAVCFYEFTSMSYMGEKVINAGGKTETKTQVIPIPPKGNLLYNDADDIEIVADDNMDKDHAEFEVTYQYLKYIDVSISDKLATYDYDGLINPEPAYRIWWSFVDYGDFFALENLKTVLKDIKDRKIYDYKAPMPKVTIKVASENVSRFKAENSYDRYIDYPQKYDGTYPLYYHYETHDIAYSYSE